MLYFFFIVSTFLASANISNEPPLRHGTPLILQGDWLSEGGRIYVYKPKYPFRYECQVQLIHSEGHLLHIQAANFWFDNNRYEAKGRDLNWFAQSFQRQSRRFVSYSGPKNISTEGVVVALSFLKEKTPDADQVFLAAYLTHPIGPYKMKTHSYQSFLRSDRQLEVKETLTVLSSDNQILETPSLEARCFKRM